MSDAKPILTFGMPLYNEEQFLEEALESLLAQTRGDWVLHISDNASTDRTQEICRRFAARDARVRYERHEVNQGAAFNWANVLEQAETPLFAWAGGHDRWAPTFYEALAPRLDNAEVILAYPQTQALSPEGVQGRVHSDNHTNMHIEAPDERFLRLVSRLGNCSMLHGIWRTERLRAVPIRQSFSPDSLLLAELALIGKYVQHQDVLFFRRDIRPAETSRERVARAWAAITNEAHHGTPGWLDAMKAYIREHISIIQSSPAKLSRSKRTLLASRTALIVAQRHVVSPTLRESVLPRLPGFIVQPLRSLWRRRPSSD
ncbi:MAG: glycosyltransferase family 2 protein [Myxococcota bacterium]